jgi:hypothetical protein
MMQMLLTHMGARPCPNCGERGGIVIHQLNWFIGCTKCNTSHIDPFSVGPWENPVSAEDHLGDETIAYATSLPKFLPEPDDTKMEFMKYLVEKGEEERRPVAFLSDLVEGLDFEENPVYTENVKDSPVNVEG